MANEFKVKNGLIVNGNTTLSGSVNVETSLTVPTLTVSNGFSGSFSGSFQGDGSSLTGISSVGGSDTQVQFNDGGSIAGDADFTWNKTSNTLTLPAGTISASFVSASTYYGDGSNLTGLVSAVTSSNTYFVDLASGNDGTAAIGRRDLPWKTIQGAIDQVVTDGIKGLVVIVNYGGDYSSENFTIKGNCSLTVEHFYKLPDVDIRRIDTAYPNSFFYGGSSDKMDDIYSGAKRLSLGTFTLDSTWTTSNFCEGFNCTTLTVNNDLTDNANASHTGGAGAGMRLSHIFASSIVRGTATWIDGYWDHVFSDGDFFDHPGVASTTINGYFSHCFASINGFNAETVSATFVSCWVVGAGFAYTDDFTGHCTDCSSAQANGQSFGGGAGGTMAGYLDMCKSVNGFAGNGSGVSGKLRNCYSPLGSLLNLGSSFTGYAENVKFDAKYIPTIAGTIRNSQFYVATNTTAVTGYVYNCQITIAAGTSIGAATKNTTGGMRDCSIIQGTGSSVAPILVQGATTAANAFNLINCTITTDRPYAIEGQASGQYIVAYNIYTNAGTGSIDPTNFTTIDSGSVFQITTNTLKI